MAIIRAHTHAPLPASVLDTRRELKAAAHARLSGAAVTSGPACNPVNLAVDPYSRVSDIDFGKDSNVTIVEFVQVADDDLDW